MSKLSLDQGKQSLRSDCLKGKLELKFGKLGLKVFSSLDNHSQLPHATKTLEVQCTCQCTGLNRDMAFKGLIKAKNVFIFQSVQYIILYLFLF